jgi:nitrite reductase (NADH) large subunit
MEKKYVIIGTGAAGYAAAKVIREMDKDGSITLIGKEPYAPYHRPRLSHFIGEKVEIEKLLIESVEQYEAKRIELKLASTVKRIDREDKIVFLDDGTQLAYSKLLIATGANPFIPPFEGSWSNQMASIRSFQNLKDLNQGLKSEEEVAVIGGGLLGLEAAWSLKNTGARVRVIEFFDSLLPRQLDPEMGKIYQEILEAKGLIFSLSNSLVKADTNDGKVQMAMKRGETLLVDHLIFSVGVRADTSLAKDAGLEVNRGIVVNDRLETSDPTVFAAGDAVELNGQGFGLWTQATVQGRIAGANMAGGKERYESEAPFTLLNIAGIRVFSVGDVQDFDKTVDAFHAEKGCWKRLYVKGDRLVGGVLIGDVSQMQRLKKLVQKNSFVDVSRGLEELLV